MLCWKSWCSVICRFASFARLIGDASEDTKRLLGEFNIVEVSSVNCCEAGLPVSAGILYSSLNSTVQQAGLLHHPASGWVHKGRRAAVS